MSRDERASGVAVVRRSTKSPLSSSSNAKLRKAIERPAWIINHDAVFLVKKLGQGAFGEVRNL